MHLDAAHPISPMLARAVANIPDGSTIAGGLSYEPKWDGFRAIVYFDGQSVEITSRGAKPLTRYFPELVVALGEQLATPCVLDGEIVLRWGEPGSEHLDWERLSHRIHPAESRIATLSVDTPASFVAFDLLEADGTALLDQPFSVRRDALELLLAEIDSPIHITRATRDQAVARRWLTEFEGAGLDGVISKPLASVYAPGKRIMYKTKHSRSADVVLLGYRVHKSGTGLGSMLFGLYDAEGELQNVGGASAFSDVRRIALIAELEPLVRRDDRGAAVTGERERTRFSGGKDGAFVRLDPIRVVEVHYDQMEGARFRHAVQFERWRPDRDAESCTFDQLERPIAYDLSGVLI